MHEAVTNFSRGSNDNHEVLVCGNVQEAEPWHIAPPEWIVSRNNISAATRLPKIVIHRVPWGDKMLIRRERKVLYATPSECGQYFTVEVIDVDMPITERSIEELQEAVEAVLRIMWKRYVSGNPDRMTPGAIEHRERLLAAYRMV